MKFNLTVLGYQLRESLKSGIQSPTGYTDQHTVPQEFLERKRIKNTDPHFMWIVGVVDKLASVAVSQNQGVVEQLQYTHSELLSHYTNNERWTDGWTEGGRRTD